MRRLLVVAVLAVLGLAAGGYALAQGGATPTPAAPACATPLGSPPASPVAVTMGTPVAVPGANGAIAASPVVVYPCGTPGGSPTP